MSYTRGNAAPTFMGIGPFTSGTCFELGRFSSPGSGAWPSDNLAIYQPARVFSQVTVRSLALANGTTVSGNIDVAIYNEGWTRLVSTGSTAQSGSYVEQIIDVTDTVLLPGLYYFAVALSSAVGTVFRAAPSAPFATACGVLQESSAFPLPATATPAISQSLTVLPCVFALCSATPT